MYLEMSLFHKQILISCLFFFLENEKNSGFSVKSLQPQHEVSIIQLITICLYRFIYSFFPKVISATSLFFVIEVAFVSKLGQNRLSNNINKYLKLIYHLSP